MIEIIGNAIDWATFQEAAQASGFTDASGAPLTGGALKGGGSWFYNAVGSIEGLPGVWVRVRFNGEVSALPDLLAAWRAAGLTIYERIQVGDDLCWSSDAGATCGHPYLDTIGVIA